MLSRLMCWFGFHKWLTIRHESEVQMRCVLRNEIRGEYCGLVMGGDLIYDRECVQCGKQDFRVDEVKKRLLAEETRIWQRLQELESETC